MASAVSHPEVAAVLRSGRDTSVPAVPDRVLIASHVPLRVFRGRPDEDVVDWTAAATRALAAAGLDADTDDCHRRAVAALESALAGAAADAVAVLPAAQRTKPADVLEALTKAFGVVHAGSVARARLYAYCRGAGESINEFAATLARRCHDVNPTMAEDEKVSHFLRALDPATAAHVLRQGVPTSLAAAVGHARHVEHAALLGAASAAATAGAIDRTGGTARVAVARVAAEEPDAEHFSHDQHDRIADRLDTIVGRLAALEAAAQPTVAVARVANRPPGPGVRARPAPPQQPPQQPARVRDRARDRWTADGVVICNICGHPGHKALHCPEHPRNRQAPQPGPGPAAGPTTRPRFF